MAKKKNLVRVQYLILLVSLIIITAGYFYSVLFHNPLNSKIENIVLHPRGLGEALTENLKDAFSSHTSKDSVNVSGHASNQASSQDSDSDSGSGSDSDSDSGSTSDSDSGSTSSVLTQNSNSGPNPGSGSGSGSDSGSGSGSGSASGSTPAPDSGQDSPSITDIASNPTSGSGQGSDLETIYTKIYIPASFKEVENKDAAVLANDLGGKIFDPESLNLLDNTKKNWGYTVKGLNKAPEIPKATTIMLQTYKAVFTGDPKLKAVYLTFDEGYENGYTSMILDILHDKKVSSAFFITGQYFDKNLDLVKRMVEEGHEIGNHTLNHPDLTQISYTQFVYELCGLEAKMMNKFGKEMQFLRPPSGVYSERMLAAAKQLGYSTVFWSVSYRDWLVNEQKGATNAYNEVMTKLHNGAVILLHAVSKDNAEALSDIIDGIKNAGYELLPFEF